MGTAFFAIFQEDGSSEKEFMSVEFFHCGTFTKYVNNNGNIERVNNDSKLQQAVALVHYSYAYSNRKILLTDIQGIVTCLFDPEIASVEGPYQTDKETSQEKLMYTIGNCAYNAEKTFFRDHRCGEFCRALEIEDTKPNGSVNILHNDEHH